MRDKLILKELSRYKIGTFAEMIYRNALFYPDQEVFKYGQQSITYAAFNSRVNRLITALQALGVKKGEVIGILSWNCLEYLDIYGAAMKGGFIISPFNPRLNRNELKHLIGYSEAQVLFVGPELVEITESLMEELPGLKHYISLESSVPKMAFYDDLLAKYPDDEPPVDVDEEDPVIIFYTSGTTGTPRGALYTQRRAMDDVKTYVMMTGLQPEDRFIMVMPLFHIGGTKVFWGYFFVGGSHVIFKTFDPAVTLKAIEEEKATDIHIVPTHLVAIFSVPDFDKYDLSSLKRCWYAASPMPLELLKKGLATWGPIFIQGYGGSETGPNVCCLRREDHEVLELPPDQQKILFSCGRPDIGVHARIVSETGEDTSPGEVGEIIVKGNTMVGFWRQPVETAETVKDGWVYTGDMGYYDKRGYIYIVDRKKDMIISGGENIFPREVEEVLYQNPAVKETAVIGVPDTYWVERVHAVVVLKEGMSITAEDLRQFCKDRLAGYKAPKTLEFVEELPKNPTGKILKRELREPYWEGRERKI
ncbi:long-chain-fatty-acid--CoA ligase [bacterium]|nr:long-chain-fatty-acid--CoA ligase [bacterium]